MCVLAPAAVGQQGGDVIAVTGRVINTVTGEPVDEVFVQAAPSVSQRTKQFATAVTDDRGLYVLQVPDGNPALQLTFARIEYLPLIETVTLPIGETAVDLGDQGLTPLGVQRPVGARAFSSPARVLVEWRPNPEYNLRGYNVWRTEVDELEQPLSEPTLVNATPIERPEFEDTTAQAGRLYQYQVSALSAAGRESTRSVPSGIVEGQLVVAFVPEIRVQSPIFNLYNWRMSPTNPIVPNAVRIPVAVESAYDVSTVSIDIWVETPTDLLRAGVDDPVAVALSGITAGLDVEATVPGTGEARVEAADDDGLPLFGAGILFNLFLERSGGSGKNDIRLIMDARDTGGRFGVRLLDASPSNAPIPIAFRDGTLCVDTDNCIHGDVDGNGAIDTDDALAILGVAVQDAPALTDCQRFAGDINLDDRIDSADAALLLRWLAMEPLFPEAGAKSANRTASFASYAKGGPNPAVALGELLGAPGDTVSIPLTIEDGEALNGFVATVNFFRGSANANGLEFLDVTLDPALVDRGFEFDMQLATSGDKQNLTLAASGLEPLDTPMNAELLRLRFRIQDTNPALPPTPLETLQPVLEEFVVNDGFGYVPRHGAPGQPFLVGAAQILNGLITGIVRNAATGARIQGVEVSIEELDGTETETNPQGVYIFPSVLLGRYTLVFERDGFEEIERTVLVESTDLTELDVDLEPIAPDDTTPPVIQLNGGQTVTTTCGIPWQDPGATASDDVDGPITGRIITINPVNPNVAGAYTVRYRVADLAGNDTEVTRTVIVVGDCGEGEPPQLGQIAGDVRGNADNAPLAGVTVTLVEQPGIQAMSNDAGLFVFNGVPEGAYTVRFERTGYETVEVPVNVEGDALATVTVIMMQDIVKSGCFGCGGLSDPRDAAADWFVFCALMGIFLCAHYRRLRS